MTALYEKLLNTQEVAEVQLDYDRHKVPFDAPFVRAVEAAMGMIGGLNPTVRLLAGPVARFLSDFLREELKKKQSKNLIGRFFRWAFGA